MANIKTIFLPSEKSKHESEMACYMNAQNEIYIQIESDNNGLQWTCLDKQTAIKFSKVLRTEISKIED